MSRMALERLRVLDLTTAWSGPYMCQVLADYGVEVSKVECIQVLDSWRRMGPPIRPTEEGWWNRSHLTNTLARNKYGITLDLANPRGREIFKRLVKIADIVAENYSPRVMENFGLSYPVLKEVNPGIIMISMPGYGMTGPFRYYYGFAASVEMTSGMPHLLGYPGGGPMIHGVTVAFSDAVAGLHGAVALLTALHWRQRTGRGQYIDLSQNEAFSCIIGDAITGYALNHRLPARRGNRHPSMAPHGCYRCKGDDRWAVIAVSSDSEWASFCSAMGNPAWAKEERFSDAVSRWQNQDELDRLIEGWTVQHDHYEVMHLLQGAGVRAAPVLNAAELLKDPHLNERCFFETYDHREAGVRTYPGMSFKLSETPGAVRMPSPCLGEHNEYILGELLGMAKEEMAQLAEENVIGTRPLGVRPA